MTIDDLKIDELEHFAAHAFREIDMQFMSSLPSNDRKLEYINLMLNTSVAQSNLMAFRLQKLAKLFIDAYKNIFTALGKVFGNVAESFRRIGS